MSIASCSCSKREARSLDSASTLRMAEVALAPSCCCLTFHYHFMNVVAFWPAICFLRRSNSLEFVGAVQFAARCRRRAARLRLFLLQILSHTRRQRSECEPVTCVARFVFLGSWPMWRCSRSLTDSPLDWLSFSSLII